MQIATSRLTSQSQISVPARVREVLDLEPTDTLVWERAGDRVFVTKSEGLVPVVESKPCRPLVVATAGFNGPGRTCVAASLAAAMARLAPNYERCYDRSRVALLDLHPGVGTLSEALFNPLLDLVGARRSTNGLFQLLQGKALSVKSFNSIAQEMRVTPVCSVHGEVNDPLTVSFFRHGQVDRRLEKESTVEAWSEGMARFLDYLGRQGFGLVVMDLDPYLSGSFERSALPFIDHLLLVAHNSRDPKMEKLKPQLLTYVKENPKVRIKCILNLINGGPEGAWGEDDSGSLGIWERIIALLAREGLTIDPRIQVVPFSQTIRNAARVHRSPDSLGGAFGPYIEMESGGYEKSAYLMHVFERESRAVRALERLAHYLLSWDQEEG
jgi:hypothetical protein